MGETMDLRLASDNEDLLFLFNTRRHPEVDKMLTGSAPQDYTQHLNYISKVQGKTKWLFVAFSDANCVGYGQVYDVTDSHLEVGFVIHPDYQGKGFGKEIVKATIARALELFPNRKVVLYVRKDNDRAVHIYRKLGFVDMGFKDDTIYMEM